MALQYRNLWGLISASPVVGSADTKNSSKGQPRLIFGKEEKVLIGVEILNGASVSPCPKLS